MTGAHHETVEQRVQREVTQPECDAIRSTFLRHCEREAAGDVDGILETMTADFVYEHPQSGTRWEGQDGARRFYADLLGAFGEQAYVVNPGETVQLTRPLRINPADLRDVQTKLTQVESRIQSIASP